MTSSSPATSPASRAASVLRATARYASREATSDVGHLSDFGDDLADLAADSSWGQVADSLRSLADDLEAEHSELRLVSGLLDVYEIPSTSPGPASLPIPLEGRVLLLAEQLAGDIDRPKRAPELTQGLHPAVSRLLGFFRSDGSDVSEAFLTIANRVAVCGGPEATVALRKLLEAQDATSRARSVAS